MAKSKQGKHINITWSGEKCVPSTPTPQRCISQVVASKQTLGGTDATTQSKLPQGLTTISLRRAQSMAKPRSKQANIGIKNRNKQANIDKYKGNDPNPLI